MIPIYLLLILVILLLAVIAIKLFSHKENDLSQVVKLSISEGIAQLKEDQNRNNKEQIKEIEGLKQDVNKTVADFKFEIFGKTQEQNDRTRESLVENFSKLQKQVEERLTAMDVKVETRLQEGFKDTKETFTKVIERLAKIDEAQKKIELLSKDVVSLQDILSDKKTRGTFGEIQLHQILSSVFGDKNDAVYELQKELFDGDVKAGRVDAIIKLPQPTGILPIDSKFPLENYRRMYDTALSDTERDEAKKQFKRDLQTRIDETSRYVIEGVTSRWAIMFLTAEAIFAEIHAYHPKVIEYAHNRNVYIASPTTLLALMNTVQALLRDQERSKYAEQIKLHLLGLGQEFGRYKDRWEKLAGDIDKVGKDVKDIHVTSSKISQRFEEISQAKLPAAS